jgi:hypothetical protein
MPDAAASRRLDAAGMSTHQQQQNRVETPAQRRGVAVALAATAVFTVFTVGHPVLTLSRAVANVPVSAAAVAWGRAHDGDCDLHRDLTVSCASMHGGYTNAGTTVGNVWLYGDLDGSARHRHESRHSDQWSMFGPAFPAWYGAETARTHGDFHRNVFERWAGLHDGGYREH